MKVSEQPSIAFLVSKVGSRKGLIFIVPAAFLLSVIIFSLSSSDYSPSQLAQAVTSYSGNIDSASGGEGHSESHGEGHGDGAHVHSGFKRPGFELPIAGGAPLRILPVGASTTKGQLSSDDNGYRRYLRELLVEAGNPVNMVGTSRDGNMTDNDYEAQNGARLDMMYRRMMGNKVLQNMQPNLILSGLGTNDVMQDYELGTLFRRYHYVVSYMLSMSPRATIVIATLPVVKEHKVWNLPENRIPAANAQIRKLVKVLQSEGKPVVLAEINGHLGVQPETLQWDNSHPNDNGYDLMGYILFNAIVEADAKGFIQYPVAVEGVPDDGNSERLDDKALEAQKKQKSDAEKTEEKELKEMKKELESFYAGVKAGQIVPIPDDPPVDPPFKGDGLD